MNLGSRETYSVGDTEDMGEIGLGHGVLEATLDTRDGTTNEPWIAFNKSPPSIHQNLSPTRPNDKSPSKLSEDLEQNRFPLMKSSQASSSEIHHRSPLCFPRAKLIKPIPYVSASSLTVIADGQSLSSYSIAREKTQTG
jgi:hypothetical protein